MTNQMLNEMLETMATNAIIWKTSKGLGIEKGSKIHIKGTIKEHSEYDDEKQTVITRAKVEEQKCIKAD